VDQHYAAQLRLIDALGDPRYKTLRALLADCQQDEVAHRDDARARKQRAEAALRATSFDELGLRRQPSSSLQGRVSEGLQSVWTRIVASGSASAVRVSRWI